MTAPLMAGQPLQRAHWIILLWERCISGLRVGAAFALAIIWVERMNLPPEDIGLIYSAIGIGNIAGSYGCSRFAARFGKSRAMIAGSFIAIPGWLLTGSGGSLALMCFAQAVAGLGLTAAMVANDAYIGMHTKPEERSRLFAFAVAFRGIGLLIGPVLVAKIESIPQLTLLIAALLAVTMFLLAKFLPESRAQEDPPGKHRARKSVLRLTAIPLMLCFLFWMHEAFIGRYVPVYAKDGLQASTWMMTMIVSAMGLTMMIAPFLIKILTRFSAEWMIAVTALLFLALLSFAIASCRDVTLLLALVVIWGLTWDILYPLTAALLSRAVSAARQTSVMALQQAVIACVSLIGPASAGALYGKAGGPGLFSLAASLAAAAALICFLKRRAFYNPITEAEITRSLNSRSPGHN